jgi:hypothetical protein
LAQREPKVRKVISALQVRPARKVSQAQPVQPGRLEQTAQPVCLACKD